MGSLRPFKARTLWKNVRVRRKKIPNYMRTDHFYPPSRLIPFLNGKMDAFFSLKIVTLWMPQIAKAFSHFQRTSPTDAFACRIFYGCWVDNQKWQNKKNLHIPNTHRKKMEKHAGMPKRVKENSAKKMNTVNRRNIMQLYNLLYFVYISEMALFVLVWL